MDQVKKKNIKKIIAAVCAVAVVIFLAAMPLLAREPLQTDGPKASILSGTVSSGSIDRKLIGGGTLNEEDAVSVSVPAAVKLTAFLASNGDTVEEGTPIASVDRVSVMAAIAQVQETLEYLSEEIEQASDSDDGQTLSAQAGGIVKTLYAQAGDSVQSVMLAHGALAVLSLDGLMAVDFQTDASLSVGSAVTVALPDGTTVTGEVAANLAGNVTVTVEDDGYGVGDTVQVGAGDGSVIGSGELYIYSPWNATAYTGTVDAVKVSEGDKLNPGDTLMVLRDVGSSAAYQTRINQRQAYEQEMLELFKLYQTQSVSAPCDGIVSGIDTDSVQLLAAGDGEYTVSLLANSPDGNDDVLYANYVGQITAVASNGWVVQMNPENIPVADYLDLSGIPADTALMTETVLHTQTQIPVFTLTEGQWELADRERIGVGDILLIALDDAGNTVWGVLVQKAERQPEAPATPETPTSPDAPVPSGETAAKPESALPSAGSGFAGMGSGAQTQEPEFELYGLETARIAAVTPQSTMTMDITVDELDITALEVGMAAQIRIDALGGEKYDAVIAQIGNSGTNNGGSSKYTVKLTMARGENMLSGMNATAVIALENTGEVLTIPASALVEAGTQTVVYTGYDEEKQTLTDPAPVEIGASDGETVQILSGLTDGQPYYYAYYDTLEVSDTPDFGSGFRFGR